MRCTVTEESFDWFAACWKDAGRGLNWDTLFVLPPWLHAWTEAFAPRARVSLRAVCHEGDLVGVAPLLIRDETASIIGSPDVCDYADVIAAAGRELAFCRSLIKHLKGTDVKRLDLVSVRPDSVAMSWLQQAALELGGTVTCEKDEVSLERALPATWEEYLQLLSSKQRHEVRRKLRRIEEAGDLHYRFVTDGESLRGFLDVFLRLFAESRQDKTDFMTADMEAFFRSLADAMHQAGLLRAGVLELDAAPVAAILGFDVNDTVYLYNSSYDPRYSGLSVGVVSKVLYIKDSIERGKKRFDFLKGNERYKYHLGGQEVQLYRCRIEL